MGVNGGKTFSTNQCLARELAWARAPRTERPPSTPTPRILVRRTPRTGRPTNRPRANVLAPIPSACSYDYGWNAARVRIRECGQRRKSKRGVVTNGFGHRGTWWLDVETGNKWETLEYGRSAAMAPMTKLPSKEWSPPWRTSASRPSGSTQLLSSGRSSPYLRVNVPFVAGVDPGIRLTGDGGGGLWIGVIHRRARGDDPVRVPRLRR